MPPSPSSLASRTSPPEDAVAVQCSGIAYVEQVGIDMRTDDRSGYTMIEITIIVVVAGLIVMIAFPQVGDTVSRMQVDGAAHKLAGDLRRARIEAMRRNVSVYVARKDSVTYEIQYLGDRYLPNDITFNGSSPDTVRFASFGPTLTGPVTYTRSRGGYSATVLVEASGMATVD